MIEDQAEFLIHDRGPIGSVKKYNASVSDFVNLAKNLEKEYKSIHGRLSNIGETLNLESLYITDNNNNINEKDSKKKKTVIVKEFKDIYHVGRFAEPEKKDVILKDLEKK